MSPSGMSTGVHVDHHNKLHISAEERLGTAPPTHMYHGISR